MIRRGTRIIAGDEKVIGAGLHTKLAEEVSQRPTPILCAPVTNIESGDIYEQGAAPAPDMCQDVGYLRLQGVERGFDFFSRMHAAIIELQLERINGRIVAD